MFITRKRYEEALAIARKEGMEKAYEKIHEDDRFRDLQEQIYRISRRLEEIDPRNRMTNAYEGCVPHC